jgi:hypothetical protein
MVREVTLHLAALDQMHDPKDPLAVEYIKYLSEGVTEFLAQIETEKFSREKLEAARRSFVEAAPWWSPAFNGRFILIQDVLWQHGLIGYRRTGDPERWVRYFNSAAWAEGDLNATLPEAEHYYMHSALLDIRTLTTEQVPPIAHVD